jgi:TolA-binding protein
MKKIALLFCAALVAGPALAGEWTLKDWLKDLDARIHRTEDKRKSGLVAAASVRGAKQDDEARKLYWKGRKQSQPVTGEELDAFKAAVALAQQGKAAEAQAGLEAFAKKYPSSALSEDAKQTLALLKAPAAGTPSSTAPDAKPADAPK